jgi:hypothetical protein
MNLSDFFYGEHFKENLNNFMIELKLIEQRHSDWFKSRPPQKEGELHDRLYHYYVIEWKSGIGFKFIDDCELPTEIQGQCMEAFYRNFM